MKWHQLTDFNLTALSSLANKIHPNYPEDEAIFAERLSLYPAGCLVLDSPNISGYILSHPWYYGQPPALNSLLRELPKQATTYYIHDIAILPKACGNGAASQVINIIETHAQEMGFNNISLIAVNNSVHFWQKNGFHITACPEIEHKLRSYDEFARFMVKRLV